MPVSLPKVNPYCAGAGSRPPVLAGRNRQLAMVHHLANQFEGRRPAENIVWTGLRGMGKTVLLRQAQDHLRDRGWLVGYHEVRRSAGLGTSVAAAVTQGLRALEPGPLAGALGWLDDALGPPGVDAPPAGGRGAEARPAGLGGAPTPAEAATALGLRPAESGGLPEDALDRLLGRLGEAAADAGVGVVLLFDELQLTARADLAALLHAAQATEGLPVAFVAAGLPDLPGAVAGAGSYAERLYYDRVDWLSPGDVREAVVVPAEEFGVTYRADALELLLTHIASYPYFAQLYAEETWKAAGTPSDQPGTVITAAHVEAALPPAQRRLDEGLYRIRYDKASEAERAYLGAMAALGNERIPSGDVARSLGKTPQRASPLRDRLLQKGIIYAPAHNVLEFAVPGFADYVRRRRG